MSQYSRPLIGTAVALAMLLVSGALQAKEDGSRYGFTYTLALIQADGRNRGILEMTGTVSVVADSTVTVQMKKAHVVKSLAGENLFRPTDDRDLVFRKNGESQWVMEGTGDAREFAIILGFIVSLKTLEETGKPPKAILAATSKGVIEQEQAGWHDEGDVFVLRESPHNGLLLKRSGKVLQGIKIGSYGQFDQLKGRFADRAVDLPVLEDLTNDPKTDHLQISVVTLTEE